MIIELQYLAENAVFWDAEKFLREEQNLSGFGSEGNSYCLEKIVGGSLGGYLLVGAQYSTAKSPIVQFLLKHFKSSYPDGIGVSCQESSDTMPNMEVG